MAYIDIKNAGKLIVFISNTISQGIGVYPKKIIRGGESDSKKIIHQLGYYAENGNTTLEHQNNNIKRRL